MCSSPHTKSPVASERALDAGGTPGPCPANSSPMTAPLTFRGPLRFAASKADAQARQTPKELPQREAEVSDLHLTGFMHTVSSRSGSWLDKVPWKYNSPCFIPTRCRHSFPCRQTEPVCLTYVNPFGHTDTKVQLIARHIGQPAD